MADMSFMQIREQLCGAVYERWGSAYSVRDIYPDRCILESYLDMGTEYSQVSYTMDAQGLVTLGMDIQPVRMLIEYLPLSESVRLHEAADTEGWQWDVVLIAPGLSKNATYYTPEVLRTAAPLFEGVRALSRSDKAHQQDTDKSVENIVGWFDGVTYREGMGIIGRFHIAEDADWLRKKMAGAWREGKADLVQFSIVASGTGKRQVVDGKLVTYVESITHAEFVDTVVDAAAGGRVLRLVASVRQEDDMLQQLLRLLESKRPEVYAHVDQANVTEAQVLALLEGALTPPVLPPSLPLPGAPGPLAEAEARILLREQALETRFALSEARLALRETMSGCVLPAAARERVHRQFQGQLDAGQVFTPLQLTEAIEGERAYLGQLHRTGVVTGFGPGVASTVHVTEAQEDLWPQMLDDFFDARNPARKHKVDSFKECYIAITGDTKITGRLSEAVNLHGGFALREAISTTTFDQILADALNRQMVRDYQRIGLTQWRSIADVVPANDFRTRHRTRMGGYANLPAVAQAAAYAALTSPTDEEATYAVSKRGGTEALSLEAIVNDDIGAIRQIPLRLARAASQTLHEFVFDFLRTNPAIYDAVVLFHATHANLTTTAFSAAEFMGHRRAMRDQVEAGSSKPLGLVPAVLVVPNELEEAAYNAFRQDTNLEPRLAQTQQVRPEIIVVDYFTDNNNWYTIASPQSTPTIEVAFLNGQEEPEIFVQDMPDVGSMFTSDQRTYKIRHIYGGAVVDFRGFQGAVVA